MLALCSTPDLTTILKSPTLSTYVNITFLRQFQALTSRSPPSKWPVFLHYSADVSLVSCLSFHLPKISFFLKNCHYFSLLRTLFLDLGEHLQPQNDVPLLTFSASSLFSVTYLIEASLFNLPPHWMAHASEPDAANLVIFLGCFFFIFRRMGKF